MFSAVSEQDNKSITTDKILNVNWQQVIHIKSGPESDVEFNYRFTNKKSADNIKCQLVMANWLSKG